MRLGVVSSKGGGSSKTTLCICIAGYYAKAGKDVLIIDCDTQASCREWKARSTIDGIAVIGMSPKELPSAIDKLAASYDVVIIDTPGRDSAAMRSTLVAVDMVLIPIELGPTTLWSLRHTVDVLDEAQTYRPGLKAGVVISRTKRTTLNRVLRSELGDLRVLGTVGERVAVPESLLLGSTPAHESPGSPAALEIEAICKEVESAIQS